MQAQSSYFIRFGSIAKAHISQDYQIENKQSDGKTISTEIPNPLALNLYTLGYTYDKKLIELNNATKHNLKNYISYYRILTDAVNIKDAHIVNIAMDFEITVLPEFNSNEVLLKCTAALKDYFSIDNWSISEPIYLSEIYVLLDGITGVQSVMRPDKDGIGGIRIYNKYNGNYSPNKYNIETATKAGIIYPPKDPAIFEVKYQDSDIKGRVVSLSF